MATADRRSPAELKQQLLQEGSRFTFAQALRLLRLLVQAEQPAALDEIRLRRSIRTRPHLSLDFPGTDITAIREKQPGSGHYQITATFLGLYGAGSPLPTFYTEDLLHERSDGRSVMRDFIDIINAPLFPIYFKSWSKHRLFHRLVEKKEPDIFLLLCCLLGLGEDSIRRQVDDPASLFRFMGLFTLHTRSAEGLRTLLSDRLAEPSLRVVQCVPRVATIPEDQRCRLGAAGNVLGEDCCLGSEIKDRMGKFRVEIGPVDIDTFTQFLPGQPGFGEMRRLTGLYLDQPLEWELRLTLRARDIRTTRLGDAYWAQLGLNTWMLSTRQAARPLTVLLQVPTAAEQRLLMAN